MTNKFVYIVHIIGFGFAFGAWQDGVQIKSHFRTDEVTKYGTFDGNPYDHLTLLSSTENFLFIGARDALYNISKTDLTINAVLNWTVSTIHREMCQFKGQVDSECHNFIRVMHGPISNGLARNDSQPEYKFIICGTNAYSPKCRWYSPDLKTVLHEYSGIGLSPFDPSHPSTSVLHHGSVYSATVADFGATDSLIYKEPLRTEQYYDLHLSSPEFVASQSYGDLALFFFRENAIEHTNCGKAIFSRVARICRHDSGSRKHKDRFTTFLKARLNCSVPGEFPFYFDHIEGTTEIVTNINNREEMLYAVFTTPPNSISASAVCGFYTRDILKAFDGSFKGQKSLDSNWGQVPESEVPSDARPGVCSNNPNHYPNSNAVAFLKSHPLMNEAVQGKVVLTMTTKQNKFSAVAVDSSAEISPYHIIYVGTDSGRVLKGVTNASMAHSFFSNQWEENESVFSQSWEVFSDPIKTLHLLSSNKLLVMGEEKLVIIQVDNCERYMSCKKCLRIRDPHCGWSTSKGKCISKEIEEDILQDVTFGKSHQCSKDSQSDDATKEATHTNSINKEWNRVSENCNCGGNEDGQSANNRAKSEIGSIDIQMRFLDEQNSVENHVGETQNMGTDSDANDIHKDISASEVNSRDRSSINSDSVLLATMSSATLSLLVGFSLGFICSRYIAARHKKRDNSSNTPLSISMNESQRLSKPIDWSSDPINPLKNNLNTATLEKEKTVKKIYL